MSTNSELPEGAEFFDTEGGIVYEGKLYYPVDYVLTRDDIAKVRAAAWDEAMEAATTGVIIDGKYVKHPNPYSQNALVVPPQDQH